MSRLPDFFQLEQFNITPVDVTQMAFRCDPERIHPDVILMPIWQPEVLSLWVDEIKTITPNVLYEVTFNGRPISVVRSGVGAPMAGDTALALGCTACRRILFAGSVGALQPEIQVGDLMMPTFSYSGDGYCRYLQPNFPPKDCFLEHTTPDMALSMALAGVVMPLAEAAGVPIHTGPVFSIDSILTQFGRLSYLASELSCIGIEMETAAVFKAARLVGIPVAALFSVSDVPVRNKTLFAGRSTEERQRRGETRSQVLAKALFDCLDSFEP